MPERTKSVGFSVSPREKESIRQAAAAEDKTMAEFARERVLNNITPEEPHIVDDDPAPLEDFITAQLAVDEDADPLPKQEVYQQYQRYCDQLHPDHDVESQHKVSREVGKLNGVGSARRYIMTDSGREQKRCFTFLRWRNPGGVPDQF